MVNQSQTKLAHMWKKWEQSGAVGTIATAAKPEESRVASLVGKAISGQAGLMATGAFLQGLTQHSTKQHFGDVGLKEYLSNHTNSNYQIKDNNPDYITQIIKENNNIIKQGNDYFCDKTLENKIMKDDNLDKIINSNYIINNINKNEDKISKSKDENKLYNLDSIINNPISNNNKEIIKEYKNYDGKASSEYIN